MEAYERLIEYTKYPTASDENREGCPSTPAQFDFAAALVDELKTLGVCDAHVTPLGFVVGTIEANAPYDYTLGFLAHMDVVDSVPYTDIKPRVISNYDGNDIVLDGKSHALLSPTEFPFLKQFIGKTLVVTDGETLLGADDKAGIAEIMTMAEMLHNDPSIKHGKIKIGFTPDEEIGTGVLNFDVPAFGADFAFTVDGSGFGEVDCETFNAASAVITVYGKNIHPGGAKNKMKNASILAMEFNSMLPEWESPEHTDRRDGFYHLTSMSGDVGKAELRYIVRDHSLPILEARKENLLRITDYLNAKYGEGRFICEIKDSYRNMYEMIAPHKHLIENAYTAVRELGGEPSSPPVRGGTDGSRLSFMGLPCPNLGTGSFNHHGKLEFACAEDMDKVSRLLIGIASKYTK